MARKSLDVKYGATDILTLPLAPLGILLNLANSLNPLLSQSIYDIVIKGGWFNGRQYFWSGIIPKSLSGKVCRDFVCDESVTLNLWKLNRAAVDQHSVVLDSLMQRRRNTAAAHRFFRKLLKSTGFAPRAIITNKLKSYGAAKKDILKGVEHRQHKGLNNRAENSHRPTRVRERRMGRFKSVGQAQRFLLAFEPIRGHLHPHQHKQIASEYRETMCQRIESWRSSYGQAVPYR